jgi:lycopene beta-cyclase
LETRSAPADCDVIFAGGGLASVLAAYRLAMVRPHLRIAVVEAGDRLGGNHTWSFHDSDLTTEQRAWLAPFIAHRWASQTVRFPTYTRSFGSGYNTITSDTLHHAAMARLGASVVLAARISDLDEAGLRIIGGRKLRAPCVIDGRGYEPSAALVLGFQKFLGQEVRCASPHGERAPVIMDAAVSQDDGYRFVYTLPLAPNRLLIEDTYYANGADLNATLSRGRIADYAASRGWRIVEVVREERGVLPVVLAGDIETFWADSSKPLDGNRVPAAPIGVRAALFHPTTGYSLPDAVRLADVLAALPSLTTAAVRAAVEERSKRLWRERGFYRLLNRMLFLAAKPHERYEVLQRFYTLPERLISRFYAASSSAADKARILIGRPPVSLRRALASLPEASARQA